MRIQDLIPEQYYYISSGEWDYICKHKSHLKSYYNLALYNKEFILSKENTTWRIDIHWYIREATQEEIQWLELCKTSKKYVERPKILLNYEIY